MIKPAPAADQTTTQINVVLDSSKALVSLVSFFLCFATAPALSAGQDTCCLVNAFLACSVHISGSGWLCDCVQTAHFLVHGSVSQAGLESTEAWRHPTVC